MQNIIKSESFIKYNKINFLKSIDKDKIENKIEDNNKETIIKKKKVINKNIDLHQYDFLTHQDFILNILMELRFFDELNGTNLFKNISYSSLNTFILKNIF